MKKTKKITVLLLMCVSLCLLFTGCMDPQVDGDTLINKARESYTKLDSGKVTITNVNTDKVEQTFTFMYDEKDVLMYSVYGNYGGEEFGQYNNGLESVTLSEGKYVALERGDTNFESYTRDSTYSMAQEGMILFVPKAVESATVTTEDGITKVEHIYNVDKLDMSSEEEGECVGFNCEYYFDKNDNLLYFVENTDMEKDGKKVSHNYNIEITEENKVEKIENPIKNPDDEKKA